MRRASAALTRRLWAMITQSAGTAMATTGTTPAIHGRDTGGPPQQIDAARDREDHDKARREPPPWQAGWVAKPRDLLVGVGPRLANDVHERRRSGDQQ